MLLLLLSLLLNLFLYPFKLAQVTLPQSLPEVEDEGVDFEAPGWGNDEKKDGVDELYPACPCFERGDLAFYQNEIIHNRADLVSTSCNEVVDDSTVTVSLVMRYIENEDEFATKDVQAMQTMQTINPPPGADPKKFLRGWSVEAHLPSDLGQCNRLPMELLGPFPLKNINTCQMFIRDACTLLKRAMCPCYDLDDIMKLRDKIANDPDFVLDMEKSCKDPNSNDGLPYGIYQKDVEITITQSSLTDRMHIYNVGGKQSYSSLTFKDELKFGVGVKGSGETVCHDGSDMARPDLDALQSTHCHSLMEYLCESLELSSGADRNNPTVPDRSADDESYRKNGREKQTCKFLTRTALRKRRNCKKRDKNTGKLVFEHCRESCYAGSCVDDGDFFFNGQKDKDCDWVAKNKAYCVDDYVARSCVSACDTECCRDDPDFKFDHNLVTNLSCRNISSVDEEGYCNRKRIANKCKMSCLKCLIEPRT